MYGAQLIEALHRHETNTARVGTAAPSASSGQAPVCPADSESRLAFFGLLLMPFQASTVNAWLNVLGVALGAAVLLYEFRARGKAPA